MNQPSLELARQMLFIDYSTLREDIRAEEVEKYFVFISRSNFDALTAWISKSSSTLGRLDYENRDMSFSRALWILKKNTGNTLEPEVLDLNRQIVSSILKKMSRRAAGIHANIMDAVQRLARESPSLDINAKVNELNSRFRKPDSADKPYHLHHTENSAGGGDLMHLIQRLEWFAYDICKVPRTWIVGDKPNVAVREKYNYKALNVSVLTNLDRGDTDEACFEAVRIANIIQAVGIEANDMFLEMNMWKSLPCAMALHSRLGKESRLGWLSQDVMQMVIQLSNQ